MSLEWLGNAKDGIPFWGLAEPPKGNRWNIPSPSRRAEVLQRQKVFKLRYQCYIEHEFVLCIIPQFPFEKLEDIMIVWDCTGNGHNDTLRTV